MKGAIGTTLSTTAKSLAVGLGQNGVGNAGGTVRYEFEPRPIGASRSLNGRDTGSIANLSFETIVGRSGSVGGLPSHVDGKGRSTRREKRQRQKQEW